MNTAVLAGGFFLAFITALCSTPLVARFAKYYKWVDLPGGERTVHNRPTPRAGGIAIIITFVLGASYMLLWGEYLSLKPDVMSRLSTWAMILGGGTIALTGLYDDAYGLGFKKKFLFQLLVAYAMYLAGYRVDVPEIYFLDTDPYLQAALGLPVTLLWYLGVMNAINLIDGIDGLAAGVSLIVFCCLATIFGLQGDINLIPIVIVLAGALLGFLVYNFNPASIFLGDTGSLFLGFMIATYALQGTSHPHPVTAFMVIVLAVGYPLLDTVLAFVRRFLKGKSPFAPDKDHVHHRMIKRFVFSTRKTAVVLYAVQGAFGLAAMALAFVAPMYMIFVIALVVIAVSMFLKWLGYLKVQRGLKLIRRRFSDQLGERIPRGQWSGDGAMRPIRDPIASHLNGFIGQKNSTGQKNLTGQKKIRPEKEDEREFVIHSID